MSSMPGGWSKGGFFALPNLRGGDEYGGPWHKVAMFEHKQNVFDDWFAAAEYLMENRYTTPAHFAIRGRSNGGLLMGAAITQGPDLFGAIWCGYPLLDMLHYQKFVFGPSMDHRVRQRRERERLSLPVEVFTVSEREAGYEISGDHVLYRRQRHLRRSTQRPQDGRADAGIERRRPSYPAALLA
jgi:Prolyl oligopeptidase family